MSGYDQIQLQFMFLEIAGTDLYCALYRLERSRGGDRLGWNFARRIRAVPASSTQNSSSKLAHRLADNGDVAAGRLAVFQGGPSRAGSNEAPISGLMRVERATRKNCHLAAARRVALKMGRRLRCSSVTSRTIFTLAEVAPASEECKNGAGCAL